MSIGPRRSCNCDTQSASAWRMVGSRGRRVLGLGAWRRGGGLLCWVASLSSSAWNLRGTRPGCNVSSTMITVGRAADCELCVEDPAASRRHCRISRGLQGWLVEDLGRRTAPASPGSASSGRSRSSRAWRSRLVMFACGSAGMRGPSRRRGSRFGPGRGACPGGQEGAIAGGPAGDRSRPTGGPELLARRDGGARGSRG